jgi:hypothetical protein
MQNTRLNTLVDASLQRVRQSLRNPWRRLSFLIISVLLGNFLATTVSTIAGQQADLDVFVAALLAGLTEFSSWLFYRRRADLLGERSIFLEGLNGLKLGLTYGLFVEALKLGS